MWVSLIFFISWIMAVRETWMEVFDLLLLRPPLHLVFCVSAVCWIQQWLMWPNCFYIHNQPKHPIISFLLCQQLLCPVPKGIIFMIAFNAPSLPFLSFSFFLFLNSAVQVLLLLHNIKTCATREDVVISYLSNERVNAAVILVPSWWYVLIG